MLATTGAVGLVLFVLLVYAALGPQPALAVVFLLGMFADGTVLGPAFWVFLVLYAAGGECRTGAYGAGGMTLVTTPDRRVFAPPLLTLSR